MPGVGGVYLSLLGLPRSGDAWGGTTLPPPLSHPFYSTLHLAVKTNAEKEKIADNI